MAHYTGYVTIPHSTYAEWRSNVLGNSYDADVQWGAQCWDLAAEFWYNVGFAQGYPLTGGNDARGIWPLREQNKGDVFDLIYNLSDVLEGDVVCFSGGEFGHIAFANENYQSGSEYIELLGQNQGGGTPAPGGGTTASINNYSISSFQGAFRYKPWHSTPPTPTSTGKSHFPWVLYARKIRQRNQY